MTVPITEAPEATLDVHSISLEPTNYGYANIAYLFAETILNDVPRARRADTAALLDQLVRITGYLSFQGEGSLMNPVVQYLADEAER